MLQVSIHPYRPEWKDQFETEKATLEPIFSPYDGEIQHIGSTSVPGLASKDVIDILIQLDSFPAEQGELDTLLFPLRYQRKDVFNLKDYLYYMRGDRLQGYHLHVTSKGHSQALVHLQFRDILRTNAAVREAYAAHKQELAKRYATDRSSYRLHKKIHIQDILEKHSDLDPSLIHQSQNSLTK